MSVSSIIHIMDDSELKRARAAWQYTGKQRPSFAIEPKPNQESVWDYPRPPVIVPDRRRVQVKTNEVMIADTYTAMRVLETASPPTFYIPPEDIRLDLLRTDEEQSFCEWKGQASYKSVCVNDLCIHNAAWFYPDPFPDFLTIKNYLAFYPSKLECYVDDERVAAQQGEFYGDWITAEIVGPFKGEDGTSKY